MPLSGHSVGKPSIARVGRFVEQPLAEQPPLAGHPLRAGQPLVEPPLVGQRAEQPRVGQPPPVGQPPNVGQPWHADGQLSSGWKPLVEPSMGQPLSGHP
mmetsp:Transcript_156881/g.278327  ORF Transcript_156881/g.278327 Transcript_156881/m.278327 type:complete len:99 (-) Transcript_156881:33-329(-)